MRVHGHDIGREDLLRYTGGADTVAGIRRVVLSEGRAKGVEALEVKTAAGFACTVLADRGLDIADASYRGVNLAFLSKNGITGRSDFLPMEMEFLHSFMGGLLTTCGLRNAGIANRDGEEYQPLHGRVAGAPAEHLSYGLSPDGAEIVIRGTLRETRLFGCNLRLHRTLRIPVDGAAVAVEDDLENLAPEPEGILVLYHFNMGYPLLQAGCRLRFPPGRIQARDEEAGKGLAEADRMDAPTDGRPEQCYFHFPDNPIPGRMVRFELLNPALSLGAAVEFDPETLPLLVQWKCMRSGDYALAFEPSNSTLLGRSGERAAGTLPRIDGFARLRFRTRFEAFSLEPGR